MEARAKAAIPRGVKGCQADDGCSIGGSMIAPVATLSRLNDFVASDFGFPRASVKWGAGFSRQLGRGRLRSGNPLRFQVGGTKPSPLLSVLGDQAGGAWWAGGVGGWF
jgi:hypothetical protein